MFRKRCNKCGKRKILCKFVISKKETSGFTSYCKACKAKFYCKKIKKVDFALEYEKMRKEEAVEIKLSAKFFATHSEEKVKTILEKFTNNGDDNGYY